MKIMILGGGSNQIDLIKKAKNQGDEVVLVDYLLDCPGKEYADTHLLISTFDVEAITMAAKEQRIDAIITAGTDQPVLSAAIASQKLGLNFYADSVLAKAVTNKIQMKSVFIENNIPTVNFKLIKRDFSDDEISSLKFPVVLKPVDSQGQRGIYKLFSSEDIHDKIESTLSYSKEDTALVEEFYENDEITVNGWVNDGKLTIISVVDRVTIKITDHIGICLCHNFPSLHLGNYWDDINKITHQIVKAFKIENGPIYFQYLIGDDGIKVNEIAMRIGGAYEGITIPLIAGIDILKMVLDYIKYKKIDYNALDGYSLARNNNFLSTQLFFCNPGTIQYMTPVEEIESLPFVKAVDFKYKVGDTIKKLINSTARAGYIIIEGSNFEDMINNVNYVFDNLKIIDADGVNLVMKYSDYEDKYLFVKN